MELNYTSEVRRASLNGQHQFIYIYIMYKYHNQYCISIFIFMGECGLFKKQLINAVTPRECSINIHFETSKKSHTKTTIWPTHQHRIAYL